MLNLALVNGFSLAPGSCFQEMTFGSRTGQFATIKGLAIGDGKQFSLAYSATNLTRNVTAAAHIPTLPDSDGAGGARRRCTGQAAAGEWASGIPDAQKLLAGTDPHDPVSVLGITQLDKSATGMQIKFPTKPGTTYRIEYTDDLKTPWQLLRNNIPGDGKLATIPDPSAKTIPQRFYPLVVVGQ